MSMVFYQTIIYEKLSIIRLKCINKQIIKRIISFFNSILQITKLQEKYIGSRSFQIVIYLFNITIPFIKVMLNSFILTTTSNNKSKEVFWQLKNV